MTSKHILGTTAFWQVNKRLVKHLGDIEAALLLSFLVDKETYYSDRNELKVIDGETGFFFAVSSWIEEETTLSYYKQKSAIKRLEAAGFLTTSLYGVPAKLHYKIYHDKILKVLTSSIEETQKLDSKNSNPSIKETSKLDIKKLQNSYKEQRDKEQSINTLSPAHEEVSKTDPLPTQTEPQENDGGKHADLPDEERRIMEAYDKVKSILDRYPATKDLWLNSAGLKWTHEQFDNELLAWIRHNASDHFLLNITRKYTKFPNWLKKAKQFAPSPKNSRVRQMKKKNDSKVIPEPSEEYMQKLRGMTMKEKLALAG